MSKRSILLLLVGINVNLNVMGHDEYLMHKENGSALYRRLTRPDHKDCISQVEVAAVLRDTNVLRLFAAADRLLSLWPKELIKGRCKGPWGLNGDTIRMSKDQLLDITIYTPWATYDTHSTSDFKKDCEIIGSMGLGFEVSFSIPVLKITTLYGQELPKKLFNQQESCLMYEAFKLSPEERAAIVRWTPIREAWIGAVVRSGNARKPVVVVAAAELKE